MFEDVLNFLEILRDHLRGHGPHTRQHLLARCEVEIERHKHHRHHHHHRHVILTVDGVGVVLNPNQETHIMLTVSVGHTVAMSYVVRNQHDNPMTVQPAADVSPPPTWTNSPSDPAVDALTAAGDGQTAQLAANAVGTDTVKFSVNIGGVNFQATLDVTVSPEVEVATSVTIEPVVT